MSKSTRSAKKAAMKAFQKELPPTMVTLTNAIKQTAESAQAPVRVEYRVGRGWIVAVGGRVLGESMGDPIKMLAELTGDA